MRTKLCSVMISTMHVVIIPLLFCCIVGGGEATFMAKPYAPLKELLSRMTNAPGSRSLRIQMAGTYKKVNASLVIETSLLRQNTATTLMFKIVSRYGLPYDRCIWLHTPQIENRVWKLTSNLLPCSLEISGLYQNLDVSWTNLILILISGGPSAEKEQMVCWLVDQMTSV